MKEITLSTEKGLTMTLPEWAEYGWLRRHKTTRQEIADLLGIVDRDLRDAINTWQQSGI